MLKGLALIAVFIGVMACFYMAVQWWDATWTAAIEPTKARLYETRLPPSPCNTRLYWYWRENGCRLI